jgi:hypothetical protein
VSVTYLYGFAPPDARLPADGLLGVGDAEVELVPGDGFGAVIARLPDGQFAGAALERNCADVEWMAEQGLRHEQVMAWFVDHAAILPSRLLTLFSSDAALRDAIERAGAAGVRATLARFDGLREWDLKVSYDTTTMERRLGEVSDLIRSLDREIAEATPGKAFLLRKKRQDLARSETRVAAARLAKGLLTALEAFATDSARLPLTVDNAPVVLNAALLIPRSREEDALALAAHETRPLAELGVTVHYTGPWAPYRFVEGGDV